MLTTTEKGQFYLYQNLNASTCLALEPWEINLPFSVGIRNISKEERDMVKLPNFQFSVIVGIMLSDDLSLSRNNRYKNAHLSFKQSLGNSGYLWFTFSLLAHYCSSSPKLTTSLRNGVYNYGLEFFTRALPCFTELHPLFYPNGIKEIPQNIYELLTPIALAHLIMGDRVARPYGLQICTDSYSLPCTVRLMNAIIMRYGLDCTLHTKGEAQPS